MKKWKSCRRPFSPSVPYSFTDCLHWRRCEQTFAAGVSRLHFVGGERYHRTVTVVCGGIVHARDRTPATADVRRHPSTCLSTSWRLDRPGTEPGRSLAPACQRSDGKGDGTLGRPSLALGRASPTGYVGPQAKRSHGVSWSLRSHRHSRPWPALCRAVSTDC